jgi:hypothetical protein
MNPDLARMAAELLCFAGPAGWAAKRQEQAAVDTVPARGRHASKP